VRGLFLERPERAQISVLREHAPHSFRANRPSQLVLEVPRAGVEPGALEASAVLASQRTQEVTLLADVVETSDEHLTVLPEEARQIPIAAHRHDGDTLGVEIPATAPGERLDGAAIARSFDEHYAARLHGTHQSRFA
jgi:hypothetical protein